MPDPARERPRPDRLALGEASRLLGVDPDTLRRWADEGRIPAFTTPGGHRRFERRALERLIASRRTGPTGGLAGLGATSDRVSAAYRRQYGAGGGPGSRLDPRALVPDTERDTFRDTGRRLVEALIRSLDETGAGRAGAEREAAELAADLGDRLAHHAVPLADAVALFVAARRPFQAELRVTSRRRGVDAARVGELYDAAGSLLDRLLLAFVAAHAAAAIDRDALGLAEARAEAS